MVSVRSEVRQIVHNRTVGAIVAVTAHHEITKRRAQRLQFHDLLLDTSKMLFGDCVDI